MNNENDISNQPIEQVVKNLLSNQYDLSQTKPAVQYIVNEGYHFSPDELAQLEELYRHGKYIAHLLAENGYIFSFDELIQLNKLFDRKDRSIAEVMKEAGHPCVYDKPIEELVKNLLADVYKERGHFRLVIGLIVESGYRFSKEEVLKLGNMEAWAGLTLAHVCAMNGYVFELSELYLLENLRPHKQSRDNDTGMDHFFELGRSVAHEQAERGYVFSCDELLKLGNPADKFGHTVARIMADKGAVFTFDELMQLGNPSTHMDGWTLAHQMADKGCVFTTAQIIALGDTPIKMSNLTISLLVAQHGHPFTFDEIMRLNNPAESYGATLAHWVARSGHRFTIDELLAIGNGSIHYSPDDLIGSDGSGNFWNLDPDFEYKEKSSLFHNGATVAHIMAREGHRFTSDEIKKLGNPKDEAGLTIANWMAKFVPPLPDGELNEPHKTGIGAWLRKIFQ